ncbi:hypothetical protein RB195_013450 [Necator americanus]|uniref:CHHC U11-48K-type domain-containing protein n=1 Tax=Necator americanus TaxID=51031 RepID=A0ABR1DVJ3_NECAM
MVVTRSGTARVDRERRERYTYAPRSHPLLTDTLGNKYIDSYLEYDCLMTPEELKRLSEHKYSAVDTSWLDELCMKYFWEWAVDFYPLWLAPNLITLIGLIVNLITVLVLSHYCPTAREVAPSWAYALAAFGLFVYQTLDATDGKQARRTGAASPLGELFDHGCDSISQVFVTLNVAYAMRLGDVRCGTFFIVIVAVSLFYCAHWSTYCTGQLSFSKFDVTEAQITIIVLLLITSVFGPNIWTVGVLDYELRHVLLFLTLIGASYQGSSYFDVIFTGGVGRNGSTVAGTSVLFPVCPLLASIVPFAMIYSKSRTAVFDENITLFVLCFGAVVAKATNRLIVGHMSRSELVLWDWIYLGPIALMLNQYYDFIVCEKKLLMELQARCAYIIPRKGRSCRMLVKSGHMYCGEHANQEEKNEDRIPCPNDPKHTVDRKTLEQHLQRCNSRVSEEEWIAKDINAVKGETKFADKIDRRATLKEVTSLIEKLLKCYESISGEVSTVQLHSVEIENHLEQNSELSEIKRKHLIQQSSIIGMRSFSAGKAQLAYWMTKRAPHAKFLLIDRSGSRNKYDNKALQEDPSLDIKRLRCSIEHLDLSKVGMLKDVSSLCAVCKHFCGSATDAGIRCLVNGIAGGLSLDGFVLVPCCHHKSRYSEYCGQELLAEWGMESESDFAALRLVAAWAVCGITLKRSDEFAPDEDVTEQSAVFEAEVNTDVTVMEQISSTCQKDASSNDFLKPWSAQWKEEIGRRAKVVLEMGRARYLSKLGFTTRIIKYVPESISPENLLILGIKNSS